MKNELVNINTQIETFSKDTALQLEKGNKAAGTRARKAALALTQALKEYRKVSVKADKK